MVRFALITLFLFAGCGSVPQEQPAAGTEPARVEPAPTESRRQISPDADYQGGPFVGPYESVPKITLASGAWFEVGDPFEAVVAALRTMDITNYDRTFHDVHNSVEIPFEVQQRRGRPKMAAWHYAAGEQRFRVVVGYTKGPSRIDRLDVYSNPTVRSNGGDVLKRAKSESVEQFNRRRATGNYIR